MTLTVGASQTRPVEQDLGVDYVPAGIARDRVQLDTQWGSGQDIYLTFKVIDTGCGFNDEQKGRIFERFSQASPRTHSKYGGSGLGLFISREMIELQSGEIGVSSRPGHGSTFAFYVAARIAEALPVAGDVSRPRAIQRRSTHENGRAKYTILVVEDNLVNQKVLRMQLQKLGHIVHVVSNGVEALQFLETTLCWTDRDTSSKSDPTIDLSVILMDMEMPVMVRDHEFLQTSRHGLTYMNCAGRNRVRKTHTTLTERGTNRATFTYYFRVGQRQRCTDWICVGEWDGRCNQ